MSPRCLYHCETKAGVFWIAAHPGNPGRCTLGVDDMVLGTFHRPETAADDVYRQAAGWLERDEGSEAAFPRELGAWTKGGTE